MGEVLEEIAYVRSSPPFIVHTSAYLEGLCARVAYVRFSPPFIVCSGGIIQRCVLVSPRRHSEPVSKLTKSRKTPPTATFDILLLQVAGPPGTYDPKRHALPRRQRQHQALARRLQPGLNPSHPPVGMLECGNRTRLPVALLGDATASLRYVLMRADAC